MRENIVDVIRVFNLMSDAEKLYYIENHILKKSQSLTSECKNISESNFD
jgi:hypothetical protein